MAKERDEKGRFVPGVGGDPAHRFHSGNAVEMARRSNEKQKEKKTIAEALRVAMYEPDPDNPGQTMLDSITGGAIAQMRMNKNISEVRILADVLGELEKKVTENINMEMKFKFGDE